MKIAAHQPNYLPNLAFFSKMNEVDLFVIITNLQFEKNEGWQQRHKIKGPNGDIWLTIPVNGSQNQLIHDIKINNNLNWQKKQIRTLELVYGKSVGKKYIPEISSVLSKKWENLYDLNFQMIKLLKKIFNIKTEMVLDSEVNGIKHSLIANICKKYGANTYVSGLGAKDYLTTEKLNDLKQNGVNHEFVSGNLTAEYPYSSVHYLLEKGEDWIREKIK